MAVNFLNNVNLNKNELQNAVLQPLATAPSSPVLGQIYYNDGGIYVCIVGGASPAWKRIGGITEEISSGSGIQVLDAGLQNPTISLKNSDNFTQNTILKWGSSGTSFEDSLIEDDGTTVTISGNLIVSGTTTTVNTETVTINDNIIVLNNNAASTPTENAGIEIERGSSTNVSLLWNESSDRWTFTNNGTTFYNIPISTEYNNYVHPTGDGNLHVPATGTTNSGKVLTAGATAGSLSWQANIAGNAGTATKWAAARTITLGGDLTGNVSIDGSANVTLTATIAANSVALGTDTTGNYVAGVTAGQGITVTGTAAEGWSPTVALSALDMTLFPSSAYKKSVRVATTANITLSGLQTIDGVTVVANDRVLVKNQTTASANGIYAAASGAWTRVADADTISEIASAIVCVDSGTANGGKHFTNVLKATDTLGTTSMPWYPVMYENGTWAISITGNAATASSATKLTTARSINGTNFDGTGNITTANWGTSRNITIGNTAKAVNGSANVAWSLSEIGVDAAISDAFAARQYADSEIGNGTDTTIAVVHNLGTSRVIVQLMDNSSGETVYTDTIRTDQNTVTLKFSSPPPASAYSVFIYALL